jgi:hypothetical protein
MKNYPVQIISTIKNKDNPIISDFIKSINYKIIGNGLSDNYAPHLIMYTFSHTNAIKFIKLLQDLGYSFKIKLYVKTIKGVAIYE